VTLNHPHARGLKAAGPSHGAAQAVRRRSEALRGACLRHLLDHPQGRTADEIAAALGESILAIRPRVCELFKQGRIEKTGEKRKNASGLYAHVWRAVP
jgi:predicted ArsR family transcriptional regulator